MKPDRPIVLTIAGSDSGAGAGAQADLKTFAAHGVYGVSALTAITAQNTLGVTALAEVDTSLVEAQIDAVAADLRPSAVKIGMLSSTEVIGGVAAKLREHRFEHVVVDPVMVTQSGYRLIRDDAVQTLIAEMLPLALVLTPNAGEAEALTGLTVRSAEQARVAAPVIRRMGPQHVLIKGGHYEGDAVDVLYDGDSFTHLSAARIDTVNTHGTGCTLSSSIAANLALGASVPEAVERAKEYTTEAIRRGFRIGSGHGPLNHFYTWE